MRKDELENGRLASHCMFSIAVLCVSAQAMMVSASKDRQIDLRINQALVNSGCIQTVAHYRRIYLDKPYRVQRNKSRLLLAVFYDLGAPGIRPDVIVAPIERVPLYLDGPLAIYVTADSHQRNIYVNHCPAKPNVNNNIPIGFLK